jgi:16S rRNA processing protein RimM
MIDPVEIGRILKTHGYKGAVKVRFDEFYGSILQQLKAVFLDKDQSYRPYFPDSIELISNNEALIHFEAVGSKEEAKLLRRHKLFARKEDVPVKSLQEQAGGSELIGYTIEDTRLGLIGLVEEVYSLPQQELLAVRYNNKEVLVPLREELIHDFQKENRTIIFNLPDGILDI